MGFKTRISAIALTVCMTLSALPSAAFAEGTAAGAAARINVQGERAASYMVIQEEFTAKDQDVKLVYNADAQTGDILVDTKDEYETIYGSEGYGIAVDNGIVTVKAAGTAGASYGLRDVLKQLESGGQIEDKTSVPFRGLRGLFVDCGRKYFSVEWFETIIREMAWNGMNTLYMSFSNDEGFRFLLDDMSVTFKDAEGNDKTYDHEFMKHLGDNPATVNDSEFLKQRNEGEAAGTVAQKVKCYDNSDYLTQDDMIEILTYAKAYGINIIPEFNSPGHNGQILWYFPEYRNIGIWGIGDNPCYALNLENQEAKNFMAAMVKKYIDFFHENGCTDFCVGGDEFKAYSTTNETIADYVNGLVDYVEGKGMTAYAWVDGQAGESGLLKSSAIVNDWKSKGAKAADYKIVNFNSDLLYHVLKSYSWVINPKTIFETWNPLLFNGTSQVDSSSDTASNVLGACAAIWCDDANAKTQDVLLTEMMTILKSFGYRTWNYDPNAANTITYENFIADATDAANVAKADVLAAVNIMKEIPQLEEQLKEANEDAASAEAAVTAAQDKLTEVEKRVTAAEQKVSAAKDQKEKLAAEAELCTARAEANKLAAEVAVKNAAAIKLKAAAAAIEAQILGKEGNSEDAASKVTESNNLKTEATNQETAAKNYQNAQAALDKAVETKKTELANALKEAQTVKTATVKEITYQILDAGQKTAAVIGTTNKNLKNAVISATVSINNVSYKVTQINAGAFKGLKNLKKATIGSNITKIEKEAFMQCRKLSNINMKKAKGITSMQKKAFSKISAKAKVTVPAKKKAKYKKMLKKTGLPKTAVIK